MKPIHFVLAASLIANAAFLAFIATRREPPPASAASKTSSQKSGSDDGRSSEAIRAALASGDTAALVAAGVAPEIARELTIGRSFSRMAEKIRAARATNTSDGRWWRLRPGAVAPGAREQQLVARRELSDALMAAFGDDFGLSGADSSHLAFLPPEKRDALRRINQDYDEMMAKFGAGGVQLASDREKLRLLRLERDRDIAALLTPEERAAYEMRTSTSGNLVKSRYGDAIESEAEFQKIYELQKAFDEKFPRDALTGRISPEVLRARAEAERQLQADIRSAVGEDRYAALRRAADPDVRTIDALASRLNLPSTVTDQVLASRDTFSTASQRIANDTSLPMPRRRAEIQGLATQAKSELTRALGSEAADAFAQRSPWMNMLQNGMAYSTTPQEGTPGSLLPGAAQGVFPVMPAGATQAGGQRQFVINAGAPTDVPLAGGFLGGENVQVMTFSSTAPTDTSTSAGGVAPRDPTATPAPGTTVITPAPPNPAAPAPRP